MLILLEASGGMMGTADGGIIGGVGLEDTLNKFIKLFLNLFKNKS